MTDQSVSSLVREARDHLTCALGHLHRLLPAPSTLTRLQPTGDPGCSSCARITDPTGKPHYEPTQKLPSGGYRTLCDYCRREVTGNRADWQAEHPGMEPPQEDKQFWPPLRQLDTRRSQGHGRFTPAQRASFRRFPNIPKPKARRTA